MLDIPPVLWMALLIMMVSYHRCRLAGGNLVGSNLNRGSGGGPYCESSGVSYVPGLEMLCLCFYYGLQMAWLFSKLNGYYHRCLRFIIHSCTVVAPIYISATYTL